MAYMVTKETSMEYIDKSRSKLYTKNRDFIREFIRFAGDLSATNFLQIRHNLMTLMELWSCYVTTSARFTQEPLLTACQLENQRSGFVLECLFFCQRMR